MRKITIISLFLFSLSLSINAQIRIVGENAEKPSSKINYYDQPLRLEETFYPFDCTRTKVSPFYVTRIKARELFLPNHQKFLVLNGERDGRFFRFQNDTIYRGIPKGYYTVDSVYVTKEEGAKLYSSIRRGRSITWCNGRPGKIECKDLLVEKINEMYSYLGLQQTILKGDKKLSRRDLIYILNNEQGISYYLIQEPKYCDYYGIWIWPFSTEEVTEAFWISIDGYNHLIDEFKGEKCCLIYGNAEDYYTKRIVPNKYTDLTYAAYPKDIDEFPYLCKDILIDNTGRLAILFVLEDEDGNCFTVSKTGYRDAFRSCLARGGSASSHWYNPDSRFVWGKYEVIESGGIISRKSKDRFRIRQDSLRVARDKQETYEQQIEAKRRHKNITTYGNHFGGLINDHKLAIGMTPEMCVASIGHPGRIYRSTTSSRTEMTYFYAYMAVRFVDGKLVRIDELL